ncbi:MAG: response regulator [Cyclobacteriaceae bacterium]
MAKSDILLHKRVLIAEDNKLNVLVARKLLEKWGMQVDVAVTGTEVVAKYDGHDLVLMDLHMPEMDGYTACEELRKAGVTVPIIAITASTPIAEKDSVVARGMNDCLSKPFVPDQLQAMIISHLS